MKTNKLYELAEKENIKIYDYNIPDVFGMFVNIDKINAITLSKNLTSYEEKSTLAEELGHYYYGATYPVNCSDLQLISKQEYRARKWAYNVLIPVEDLVSAIKRGLDNTDVLSDYFEVPRQFMSDCIDYYKERGVLCAKTKIYQKTRW